MDEENNNQEQITEEKSQQTAQETNQGAKDGANLAKNVASGNYLGAAKNAVNLAKNKTARRAMIMHTALSILAPILLVFIVACIVLGVFNAVGDGIQSVIESIGEFFEVDLENDLVIKITDEAIDKMIESIESQGISLDDLHLMGDAADYNDPEVEEKNKEALRKYIREFYEAQAVTQTLYPSPSWYQKFGDKTYGTVYVQRVKPDDTDLSKVTKLKYIKYSDMEKKVTNGAGEIKEYFSINPTTKKLVVPNTTQTIIKVNGNQTKNETIIGLTEIDYKSVISQYTTSMNFLVYLTMITQNPEFAEAVADLIKDSDIRITIMDKVTTSVTNEERNYIVNTKAIEPKASSYLEGEVTYEEKKGKPVEKTDITNTTVISTTPVPAVNYAKTWFSEQTIQYNKKDEPMQGNSYDTEPYTEPEPSISGEGSSATWITEDVTTVTTSGNIKKYEETSRGDVIDKLGEKGDGKKSFVGLLDVKFRIPNQTRGDKAKESAGGNLVSGAEMFFHLLQKDSNSQNLENIMRYALYKYTGNSYGVTKLDLSIFDIKDFVSVGGNLSAFGTNLTREKFIAAVQAYSEGGSSYDSKMVPYAGDFYDICVQYNVNPALAFAHSCLETGYGEGTPGNNYFGMAIYNGASSGATYASVADSIEAYCKWIVNNATPGTGAYNANTAQAQEYAIGNSKLNGTPDTNIYALYCRYAYLGDTHICDEPSFANPAGTSYYQSHGSTWGAGGRIYIYEMYQNGGLYTGEYASRCGHSKGSDPTTITERADYSVYTTDKRIKIAQKIFGDNIFMGNFDVDTVTAAGYTFPHYLQGDYPGAYGTSTIPRSGCGPTSLAMILAGLKGDASINPQTVVANIAEYWPSGSYYVPGVGSSHCIFESSFLQKYYGVTSRSVDSDSDALQALENGYPVIGGEDGHILAIIPAPDSYKSQGYKFYILDSARGHSGPYKSMADANEIVRGSLGFIYIIMP